MCYNIINLNILKKYKFFFMTINGILFYKIKIYLKGCISSNNRVRLLNKFLLE